MDPDDPFVGARDSATRALTPGGGQVGHAHTLAAGLPHGGPTSMAGAPADGATAHASGAAALSMATTDPGDALVGTVVADRYRLLERLGVGGMGAVYRGEHVTLKKRVAVKFLHREMSSNRELVARFEREAVAAANLDHPNIVAATDFGRTADGTFFLVMEFVDGRSLRALLQQGGRPPGARSMRVLRQIAAALARAHSLGIVHRDLKPENVVVTDREGEQDVVKVIDFGIARVTGSALGADGPALTQLGAVFGTPEYMAPEQAMGQTVDPRADQYALGVIAFEMLTGRRPFHAEDAIDLLRLHVGAPPPVPRSLAPDLPAGLDAALLRMLAKRPEERFESVAAAMEAIERAVATPTMTAMPAAAPPRPAGPAAASPTAQLIAQVRGLNPQQRSLVVGVLVAAVGVVLFTSLMLFNARRLFGSHSAASETFAGIPSAEETRALTDRLAEYQRLPDVADALARSLRGDTDGAVAALRARVAAHPDDGLAAYFLGTVCWTGRRVPDAVAQFTSALHHEPALAADPTLAHAVVAALSDRDASGAADALLRSAPLAQSPVAAQAAAEEAINGLTASARNRALVAAAGMASLLPRLDRARVMLRAAESCEDLRAALDQLDSLGPGDAADDARAVRAGECGSLRMRDRCQECVGGGGEDEDERGRGRRGH